MTDPMEKRTLGGSKKLVFAPKKPSKLPAPPDTQPLHPQPALKPVDSHKRYKPSTARPALVPFSDQARPKTTDYIVYKDADAQALEFGDEADPLLLSPGEHKAVGFGEDVMFLFSGQLHGGSIAVSADGRCFYRVGDKLHSLVPKELGEMCVASFDEDVREVGNVYNGFVVCRNDV